MIRRWLITFALLCLAVTLGYVWHRCAHTVPLAECSDIYRRYADTPGVNAAYIKDYRVNDTLTISATVLEATDSTGWETLYKDFKPAYRYYQNLEKGRDALEAISIPPNNDIAVVSHRDRYICIFHIENPIARKQIEDAIFDKIFFALTNKQDFHKDEENN